MKFFNRNIGTIYAKELKDILRDRRTLFVAIILPIIINPLLIIGLLLLFSSQTEKEMQKSFTAVIIGEEHAPELTKIIREYNPNPLQNTLGNFPQSSSYPSTSLPISAALVKNGGFTSKVCVLASWRAKSSL